MRYLSMENKDHLELVLPTKLTSTVSAHWSIKISTLYPERQWLSSITREGISNQLLPDPFN